MARQIIKGQNVHLLMNVSGANQLIAASTSCDLSVTVNTTDAAAKDDAGQIWDNPIPTTSEWSMNNESFICDIAFLRSLLDKVVNGDAKISIKWLVTDTFAYIGDAIVSSLKVTAPAEGYATLSLSLEGCTPLTRVDQTRPVTLPDTPPTRIKGKPLMVYFSNGGSNCFTICAATSHTLTISCQTASVLTKDDNEKQVLKEVTGKSISLSTENLLEIHSETSISEWSAVNTLNLALNSPKGKHMIFGYFANSIGKDVETGGENGSWKNPEAIIEGTFMVSSFSMNAPNKENVTYSVEFQGQGKPTISAAPSAAALAAPSASTTAEA